MKKENGNYLIKMRENIMDFVPVEVVPAIIEGDNGQEYYFACSIMVDLEEENATTD